ncbi:hypothetical protein [Cupriavidus sp. TMH.W2]|uniref:hypothetical protein n=1 Tax=Cupriavidus sp. TMH.W2 TaxID=3434465 RepID=UPI003D788C38
MTSAYFASLVTKPDIITAPGNYVTRSGELVTITVVSWRQDHGCIGTYGDGKIVDKWHKSGRIFAGAESGNDIVRAADAAGATNVTAFGNLYKVWQSDQRLVVAILTAADGDKALARYREEGGKVAQVSIERMTFGYPHDSCTIYR